MPRQYEYIHVHLVGRNPKTNVYAVHSKKHPTLLGTIRWFGRWRQYVMFPEPDSVWSAGCLSDIADFIAREMGERRLLRMAKKGEAKP